MALSVQDLIETARLTLRDPRQGARVVMGWPLTTREKWMVLLLMATVSALLAEVLYGLTPGEIDPNMGAVLSNPISFAALQFVGLAAMTLVLVGMGRPFGGRGTVAQALALVGWLQAVLLVLQAAQIVAILVLPFLGLLIGVASLVLALWLVTSFTAELHGFRSLFLTLIGLVAAFLLVVVALSIGLIVVFGVGA